MVRTSYVFGTVAPLALLSACGASVYETAAHQRAASDFGCPDNLVKLTSVGEKQYHATGCGKSDVYKCLKTGANESDVACEPQDVQSGSPP
ncbi:hypothetical protein [Pendulispora albinea]|uniref:Lipoprotein n=1 Tax=Pendulispora albinea TaxID=2741071 RepID=A0ABZ2M110_9BACT